MSPTTLLSCIPFVIIHRPPFLMGYCPFELKTGTSIYSLMHKHNSRPAADNEVPPQLQDEDKYHGIEMQSWNKKRTGICHLQQQSIIATLRYY